MERLLTQPKQGRSSKVMPMSSQCMASVSAMHLAPCFHDYPIGRCMLVAELNSGELLFVFRRGDAWASVGTAVATVAAEGQRILWQPLSVGDDTPAAHAAAPLPSPADQPAPHVGTNGAYAGAVPGSHTQNGSIASQAKPATASQNGSTPPVDEPKQQHRQQRQPVVAAAATEEAAKASVPAQLTSVIERAPAQSPVRSARAQNGSQPLEATAARQATKGASLAAQGSALAAPGSKAHSAESSAARPELESHPQASTTSATESQPALASVAHSRAHSASLPDTEPSTPQPDDARSSSGASRREARQASGRVYVESLIAGAEATWREAGLAGSGADVGGTGAVDPREPCLAAQKAAVTAAKVRRALLLAFGGASVRGDIVLSGEATRKDEHLIF